jgi:hypothetical protein
MDSQELRALQEAYSQVYNELDEGFKEFPSKKVYKKAMKKPTDDKGWRQNFNMMDTRADFKNKEYNLAGKAKAKEAENRARGTQKEEIDIYDIILSHLLDEGYAETQEQAEVIMVNMSEEWRESIVEGMQPLPVGKMIKQAARHSNPEQVTKMGKVADDHNPNKSKRKEDNNRREGGRKRDAGRPRSNELQDNW